MTTRWTMEDVKRFQEKNCKNAIHSFIVKENKNCKSAIQVSFALGRMKAGKMNKTEAAYAKLLETKKQIGEVLWYEFEPMNLRLADKCFYSVDFLVMLKSGQLECHEVKGFWTDDALVKIKTAAQKFPFRFISVKLVKGNWEIREF